ncbi:MAG TPA: hypothetical protein VK203_10325 [Nostocaceae cyanobacterium]|nr:hypothetical protein [Nostocaceae cyanobacterium]
MEKLTINLEELVDIYNHVPYVLERKAVKVSLQEQSLVQQNQNAIFLEGAKYGNYWVVGTEDDNYWLLPKVNFKMDAFKYDILKYLFDCEGYPNEGFSRLVLILPAKVSFIETDELKWKLDVKGKLEFKQISTSNLETELELTTQELETAKLELQQVTRERDVIHSQTERFFAQLNLERQINQQQIEKIINEQQQRFNALELRLNNISNNSVLSEDKYHISESFISDKITVYLIEITQESFCLLEDVLQVLERLELEIPKTNRIIESTNPYIQKLYDGLVSFNTSFVMLANISERKSQLENLKNKFEQLQKESKITSSTIQIQQQENQPTSVKQEQWEVASNNNKNPGLEIEIQEEVKDNQSESVINNESVDDKFSVKITHEYKLIYDQAMTAYIQQEYDVAARLVEDALQYSPREAHGHLLKGHIYYVWKQYNVAKEEYEQVLSLTKDQELTSLAQQLLSSINHYFQNNTGKNAASVEFEKPENDLERLVNNYNQNPYYLADSSIEVAVTEESINQHRLDANQPIVVKKVWKGRGSYWVIKANEIEQYLVTKGDIQVTESNLSIIQCVFELEGYIKVTSNYKLVKPAIASRIDSESWQITKRGLLKF